MDKELVLAKIKEQGIVAVVRGKDELDGVRIADACIAGGVKGYRGGLHHAPGPRVHQDPGG
jgi:2-keto-3-deoxy-6-phosphogluconate aldolase